MTWQRVYTSTGTHFGLGAETFCGEDASDSRPSLESVDCKRCLQRVSFYRMHGTPAEGLCFHAASLVPSGILGRVVRAEYLDDEASLGALSQELLRLGHKGQWHTYQHVVWEVGKGAMTFYTDYPVPDEFFVHARRIYGWETPVSGASRALNPKNVPLSLHLVRMESGYAYSKDILMPVKDGLIKEVTRVLEGAFEDLVWVRNILHDKEGTPWKCYRGGRIHKFNFHKLNEALEMLA